MFNFDMWYLHFCCSSSLIWKLKVSTHDARPSFPKRLNSFCFDSELSHLSWHETKDWTNEASVIDVFWEKMVRIQSWMHQSPNWDTSKCVESRSQKILAPFPTLMQSKGFGDCQTDRRCLDMRSSFQSGIYQNLKLLEILRFFNWNPLIFG